jgi:membrane protease YdiL (CAAX protease family)
MHFSESTLLLYLLGSMAFCWVAVAMANANRPAFKIEFPKSRVHFIVIAALYIFLFAAYLVIHSYCPPLRRLKEFHDLLFAGLMIGSTVIAAIATGGRLSSFGLSFRGIETTVFFLVPPAALLFLPGHFVNLKTLWGGIGPLVIVAGFAGELFFRGFVQTRLDSLLGKTFGLLATAAAYTVFRLPMIWGTMPAAGLAANLIGTFLIWGCAAGLIYRRAGSVYGLALLFIFWDTALRVFLGFGIGR